MEYLGYSVLSMRIRWCTEIADKYRYSGDDGIFSARMTLLAESLRYGFASNRHPSMSAYLWESQDQLDDWLRHSVVRLGLTPLGAESIGHGWEYVRNRLIDTIENSKQLTLL